jgi:pyruvate,water dikinase
MKYVLALSDPRACDVAVSGGKGTSLAKLTQAGFPVPPGFVISTDAYRDAIRREPPMLPRELVAAVGKLCAAAGVGTHWAVRSSGTAEDSTRAAFAGQHDTFLNCVGAEEVLRRVRDCWTSLWSPRAMAYREQLGIARDEIAMAVVVQQMVNAESAGVAFTIDPVRGSLDTIVIDANFGLGESVVAGETEVDHIAIDRRSWTVASKHIACKTTRVVSAESGTTEMRVDGVTASRPALTEHQAIAIARLAAKIEDHSGWPQDVEWAIADSRLMLLQSRPITTVPPRWTRDESAERFPNVVTPLTWDFVDEGFHRSLNHSFALMGLPAYDGKWFASVGYYIYGNQNAVELYARRSPVPRMPLPQLVEQLPSIVARFRWIADLPSRWHEDLPGFLHEIDALIAEPVADYDLTRLWEYLERVNATGTRYFLPNIAISIGHGVLHRALRALVGATVGDAACGESICTQLVACETMTTRVNTELRALVEIAKSEGLTEQLLAGQSRLVWEEQVTAETPFWSEARRFLAAHGHRETDFDAYHPTWAEAPWVIIDHVRALLDAPRREQHSSSQAPMLEELEIEVIQALPLEMRGLAARVIALAREYTALDDLEHYHTTRLSLPLRRGVRAIGRHLRALGIVTEELDVFFARAASLRDAITDPTRMQSLRREIATNKADYLRAREATPSWSLSHEESSELQIGDDQSMLNGIPGSPGEAEGVVHVVRDSDDFASFPRGAVLVARTTNPAWTPLFYSAAAVVTESGGPLSHGAVTAREMHIPAVMSVRGVLERLRNGDRVRVNGMTGRVEVLPAARA